MLDFLRQSNFFYAHQYGFRQGLGTDSALMEIADLINQAFDNQKYICGLFLDLRKAFDCIDHELLKFKLYRYGFRGISYKLLESFLHNRKQFVTINEAMSSTLNIKCGVPQGSVLGPLLFLIFINDIARLPLSGHIRMFADDTAMFYKSKDCALAMQNMRSDIEILMEYFRINRIQVNFSKTKFITFHSPFLPHCELPLLEISNHIIERVDCVKYLGVILDKHMTWEDHINAIRLKIIPFICLINKLALFVPVHILKMIYFSFIQSRLLYGIGTFGAATQSKLKKLQVMQNKSLKAVYKLPRLFPTIELFKTVTKDILPINALFELYIASYMYKCLNSSVALSNVQFQFVGHGYLTRNANLLKCCQIKTEFGRHSLSFIGPFIYNSVPEKIFLNSKKC